LIMAITINGSGTITGITAGGYPDATVTADDLAATLDLSGKTVTLADGSVTAGQLATTLDLSGKTVTLPSGTGGKLLQVVQTEKTDVSSSVTGTAWTDFGLSVDITPSSSSSKILVLCQMNISNNSGYDVRTRLMRDSTPIFIGDAAGSRPRASTVFYGTYQSGYGGFTVPISYVDSPGTTSQITYKVQGATFTTSTVYLNRGPNDTDNANYESRTPSSIIVMEVAG